MVRCVGILTAGGLAPCLASAVGGLIERYTDLDPTIKILCYLNGFQGLLLGQKIEVTPEIRGKAELLHSLGGSPLGNSRVKLSNVADCVKRGLVKEGQDPRKVAADQLVKDGVDALHTIGGDDTSAVSADLLDYLERHGIQISIIGVPTTIDNDIFPVRRSLGAYSAAEQTARFFQNVVSEQTASPRVLLIHEVMGRRCGYLTAAAASCYRKWLNTREWLPEIGHSRARYEIHAVYIPEMEIDLQAEAARLHKVMDEVGSVNVFLSEGAGIEAITAELQARGKVVPTDAFGHVKLDLINPGLWFGTRFGKMVGAEKVLVQKSGYFGRSCPGNSEDIRHITSVIDQAVGCARKGASGLIGHDEERGNILRAIEFNRVKGSKPFNPDVQWFLTLLNDIGQPKGAKIEAVPPGSTL